VSRPSEPLLRWLRKQIDAREENTSSLAQKLGRPKAEVRRILTGADPLTVDDLVRITELLGISEDDLGVTARLQAVVEEADDTDDDAHWDNQPRALVQFGFDRGIDFMLLAASDELGDWGGPARVAEQYRGREVPLQLDAAWHKHMKAELGDEGLSVTLSFDGLYRCWFPWAVIKRVIFIPMPPAPQEAPPPPSPPPEAPKARPHLRLVK
jgi:plasmid maintenance system antidote protein VapI